MDDPVCFEIHFNRNLKGELISVEEKGCAVPNISFVRKTKITNIVISLTKKGLHLLWPFQRLNPGIYRFSKIILSAVATA